MKKSQITIKTGEDVPDANPILTRAIATSHDSIRVTWMPIPKHKRNGIIKGYNIYYKMSSGYIWKSYTCSPPGNTNTCIAHGLAPFTWYCVKMSAFTSKGEYPEWKKTRCKTLRTPSPPINVSGIALSESQIKLKFSSSSGHSQSNVVHYGERRNALLKAKVCSTSGCFFDNLKEDTLYYFKVIGMIKQIGESATIIQVRTKKNDPSSRVPVIGKTLSSSKVLLKIYSTGDYSSIVHYGENISYLDKGKECIGKTCVIGGLKQDTLYYFKVFGVVTQGGDTTYVIQLRTRKGGP